MTQEKTNGKLIAIITMCFIFAMISFVTNMGAPFGNIWGFTYPFAKAWGNAMNFIAYLFMGIPAGKMLIKYGYKKTALIALVVGIVGLAFQYLSSITGDATHVFTYQGTPVALNLIIYLLGAFICGFCVCMLNTVVNPMLNLLGGGGNKGNQLIQWGGTCNSTGGTLAPIFVGWLVGGSIDDASVAKAAPVMIIAMAIFAIAFCIIWFTRIPEPHMETPEEKAARLSGNKVKDPHSALSFRHFVLGAVAIFFYVGIEVGIPNTANVYFSGLKNVGPALAGTMIGGYWFSMLIGRLVGASAGSKVSSRAMLGVMSAVAILLVVCAIFIPETVTIKVGSNVIPLALGFLVLCGLCTSIMWGAIFNLAVEGLGKYTAAASGIFMTLVCGGGIIPFFQNLLADHVGSLQSYWLIIACLAFLVYYAFAGSKNVNTDIKVD